MKRNFLKAAAAGAGALLVSQTGFAQKRYDTGATDKEIKLGNISPYSGNLSAYGAIGKALDAYFKKVNAEGGINGRMIKFISLDDSYNPARTLEMARKLTEEEEVLATVGVLGTPTNSAIHKYMNQKKMPQLFVATGATKWGDPKNFPWTMGWQPNYQSESMIYAQHLLESKPNAKIAILFQNDDYGKDYLKGFLDGLGDKAKTMIVKQVSYESTDPTVDSQMVELKASGADVFFNITTPKFAAQAIKKAAEIGWKPQHYLNNVSNSAGAVMLPAGAENGVGILSVFYLKDPTDSQWANTPEFKEWMTFMQRYMPGADLKDLNHVFGYTMAQGMTQVLKQAGDNLTRENIMRQAANVDMNLPMLLPGVNVKTGADDFYPIERGQLARWDGKTWVLQGKIFGR
jgi:ABC-type branched-subunit amino acid transport system substrate-binding protein